jgi:hypothetical protein
LDESFYSPQCSDSSQPHNVIRIYDGIEYQHQDSDNHDKDVEDVPGPSQVAVRTVENKPKNNDLHQGLQPAKRKTGQILNDG